MENIESVKSLTSKVNLKKNIWVKITCNNKIELKFKLYPAVYEFLMLEYHTEKRNISF